MILVRTDHPYLRVGCYSHSLGNLPLLGLIRCQGNHDDYACLCGGVAMSDGDSMGSSDQVHGARCGGCLWLRPIMSAFIRHCFCKVRAVVVFTRYWRAPGVTTEGLSQVTRRMYSGLVGDKILTIRGYCDGREDRHGLFPGLSSPDRSGETVSST
jgi:hypothetical protein